LRKLFASLIFGLLVSGIVSGSLTPVYGAGQLYGLDGGGSNPNPTILYSIDTSTGATTPIGTGLGFSGCGAMDFDPVDKKMYATCGNAQGGNGPWQLITINLVTGVGTLVATITGSVDGNITDISFRSDNTLFFMTGFGGGNSLHTLNKVTGFSTLVGASPQSWGNGIAFSPSDTLFHSAGQGDDNTGLNTLNQVTGAPGPITLYTLVGFPPILNERANGMDFMPGSNVIFANIIEFNGVVNYIATIDPDTATVTHVGLTVSDMEAVAFELDVPPPPPVGGEYLPIDSTSLLVAGAQSFSWMIPVVLSVLGIGLFVVSRKPENS